MVGDVKQSVCRPSGESACRHMSWKPHIGLSLRRNGEAVAPLLHQVNAAATHPE